MLGPRVWIGKDNDKGEATCRFIIDCPTCGKPAIVRDPDTAVMSGKSWVDCTGKCGPNVYIPVNAQDWAKHKAGCKGHKP